MGTILVALVLMLGGGPAVSKQEAVVGQESLTKAQEASKLVYKLDSTMMADYAATQRLVGESQSPVILALFNGVGGDNPGNPSAASLGSHAPRRLA